MTQQYEWLRCRLLGNDTVMHNTITSGISSLRPFLEQAAIAVALLPWSTLNANEPLSTVSAVLILCSLSTRPMG